MGSIPVGKMVEEMSKIKVSEIFYSIQGEGRYMGVPSIFLRTFGCNFTCSGFGMPNGLISEERNNIDPSRYDDYKKLPLVYTGCDSYASWDPRFKHLSPVLETDAIVERILELLPFKEWKDEHLVITGGEPLLGWQKSYPDLLNHEKMANLKELTFETNGTQMLSDDFFRALVKWEDFKYDRIITFSVSPKLSGSGEAREDAIKPEVVEQLYKVGHTYLKLVVATEEDVNEALEIVKIYRKEVVEDLPVYLMPVGGVESVYSLNNKRVAELAMKNGLRYSDRLQVPLFKNAWGT